MNAKDKALTELYASQIEDCEKREGIMSDWEVRFIDSISCQFAETEKLTTRQAVKLDEIWTRLTDKQPVA